MELVEVVRFRERIGQELSTSNTSSWELHCQFLANNPGTVIKYDGIVRNMTKISSYSGGFSLFAL